MAPKDGPEAKTEPVPPKKEVQLSSELPDEIKDEIAKVTSDIESRIEKTGRTERFKLMQCNAEKVLEDPINGYTEQYKKANTMPEKQQVLKDLTSHLAIIKAIVDSVCPEGVRMRAEDLQKIIDYGQMLSADPKYKDMRDAVRWRMGMPVEGASSVDSKDAEKAKNTLITALRKDEKDPEFAYACTLISGLEDGKKMEIIGSYLVTELKIDPSKLSDISKDPAQAAKAKTLLVKLNKLGAVSPMEIERLVGSQNITDKEKYEYSKDWDTKRNMVELNKFVMESSYGARNTAEQMLTLKNIILFVGMLAGSATVAANILVHLKKPNGEGWRKSPEDIINALKNPYVVGGAGVAFASKIGMSKGGLDEVLADKEKEKETYMVKDFQADLNASPGFRHLFEDDNYKGLEILSTFVNKRSDQKSGEFKEKAVTLEQFKLYLEEKKSEPGYSDVLSKIDAMGKNEHESESLETRFNRFTKAIHTLKVGGVTAVQSYQKICNGEKIVIHKD